MCKKYKCSICGKQGVKLWRPYGGCELLVCAECAEKRQSPMEYDELTWKKEGEKYIGEPTGRKLLLENWRVDEKGKVQNYDDPGPEGIQREMTDQLIVNFKKFGYDSGKTTLIPAIPYENRDNEFWKYGTTPKENVEWWENLPTR